MRCNGKGEEVTLLHVLHCSRFKSRQPRDESCSVDLAANIEDGCDLKIAACSKVGVRVAVKMGARVAVKKIANLVAKTDANLAANLACQMATNM